PRPRGGDRLQLGQAGRRGDPGRQRLAPDGGGEVTGQRGQGGGAGGGGGEGEHGGAPVDQAGFEAPRGREGGRARQAGDQDVVRVGRRRGARLLDPGVAEGVYPDGGGVGEHPRGAAGGEGQQGA